MASNSRNRLDSDSVSTLPVIPGTVETQPIEKRIGERSSISSVPNTKYIYFNDNARKLRVRERTYDVHLATSKSIPYEPLLDNGLADFFNTPTTRRHLIKQGFIDHEGKMVGPKRYKDNQIWLNTCDKEVRNRKLHEKTALDREVEVTIRRAPVEGPPKYLGGRRKKDEKKSSEYPVLLRTTAELYTHPNPMLEKARRIFAQSRKTILENRKEKIIRSSRPNIAKKADSNNNTSRKDARISLQDRPTTADGNFRGRTNVSFAAPKKSNIANTKDRNKKVVNRGTETDATDHPGIRFVRPHSAPPRRGQIVTSENDWSESELGDGSQPSSTAALRPTSARATGWPEESEEYDDDFAEFEAQQSEADSEDEQQQKLPLSANSEKYIRQKRSVARSQDWFPSEYHAGYRLAVSLLESNQLAAAEAKLRKIAEAMPDPSKKIKDPLLRNLTAKVQLTLAKTLYRIGGREDEWAECVERAIVLGESNLKLLESISQFEEEVNAGQADRQELTDAVSALISESIAKPSAGNGKKALPRSDESRSGEVVTSQEGIEAVGLFDSKNTTTPNEEGDQSGYETDFDVGEVEEPDAADDSSIDANIRTNAISEYSDGFEEADAVPDEGNERFQHEDPTPAYVQRSLDFPKVCVIEKTPEIFEQGVDSVARSQHGSVFESEAGIPTAGKISYTVSEAPRTPASGEAFQEEYHKVSALEGPGVTISSNSEVSEGGVKSEFSGTMTDEKATANKPVSPFSRQATCIED